MDSIFALVDWDTVLRTAPKDYKKHPHYSEDNLYTRSADFCGCSVASAIIKESLTMNGDDAASHDDELWVMGVKFWEAIRDCKWTTANELHLQIHERVIHLHEEGVIE